MKYYRLVKNFDNYGYFKKDIIYPGDVRTNVGVSLLSCLISCPDDWEEVFSFKFGR